MDVDSFTNITQSKLHLSQIQQPNKIDDGVIMFILLHERLWKALHYTNVTNIKYD